MIKNMKKIEKKNNGIFISQVLNREGTKQKAHGFEL